MKITQSSSANPAISMAVAAIIVIMSVGVAVAGPRFNPHDAKGGLPDCMVKLNEITANYESCETNLIQAQEENFLQQEDLEACNMDLNQLLTDLTMGEENEGSAPEIRFSDNGDGTVTDNLTGLVWTKNANMTGGSQTWSAAVEACNDLEDAVEFDLEDGSIEGDWRLPNVRELQSLIDYGVDYMKSDDLLALPTDHPFEFDDQRLYWTSTTDASSNDLAWAVSLVNGYTSPINFKFFNYGVWCVRDGQ